MPGLGTIINAAAIIIAGIIGSLFKKGFKKEFQDSLIKATGVCVLFIGIGGALSKMFSFSNGVISTNGTLMTIISFALGTLIGMLLKIDDRIVYFGEWLKKKTGNEKDRAFVDAFVTASLTVCIGAMAIVGAIQDSLYGDYSTLIAKSILDFIIVLVLTPSLGKGCAFSALPVILVQGLATLLAKVIEPILTEAALLNLSLVGSMLIFCIGVNLIWKDKFKVANMLPAIAISVIWAFTLPAVTM